MLINTFKYIEMMFNYHKIGEVIHYFKVEQYI